MKLFNKFILFLILCIPYSVIAWGFFGHRLINRIAIFSLPPLMFPYFRANIDYLTDHAVDPDKRRYSDSLEAVRHYIDLDHYEVIAPVDSMPQSWKAAIARYSEDTLKAYGIVPWHIQIMLYRLTDAFQSGNEEKIMHCAADIGHYIADACVPLHATENYNGQLTNQHGIHGFWESRLPELFIDDYDLMTGRASYIDDPLKEVWNAVTESFAAKDSVLIIERELSQQTDESKKYTMVQKGNKLVKTYAHEYALAYHKRLNGMVERRMRRSIQLVASLWYTAWVNAGQPDLTNTRTRLEKSEELISDSLIHRMVRQMIGRQE